MVKDVRQEIARINHIVADLLQTARPHPPKVRKSDLNTTVEHAVMLGRQQALAKSVAISLYKDPTLPEVEHDSDQSNRQRPRDCTRSPPQYLPAVLYDKGRRYWPGIVVGAPHC